jgi:hypothetical protein
LPLCSSSASCGGTNPTTGQFVDRRVYEEAFDYCGFLLAVRLGGTDAGDKERAACAHLACAATLRTALGHHPFLNLPIDDSTRDGDIGFSDADAARWAAESVAPKSVAQARW